MITDIRKRLEQTISLASSLEEIEDFLRQEIVHLKQQQHIEQHQQNNHAPGSVFAQALEHIEDAILITDLKGRIEYINAAFSTASGYQPEEIEGTAIETFKFFSASQQLFREISLELSKGNQWQGEIQLKRKDGSYSSARISALPLSDQQTESSHFIIILHAACQQKQTEDRLRDAQKLEALGTLVSGITHDFNNILMGLNGMLFLARSKSDQPLIVESNIANAEKIVAMATSMTRQLLDFSRMEPARVAPFQFRPFIREALKLASISIPDSISISTQICDDNMTIHGDPTQIQQILLNLFNNARDAIEAGSRADKTIVFETSCTDPIDALREKMANPSAEHYLCISISDNGIGIPPDQIDRIFEPFFTTKDEGRGTGLGLAMTANSVRSHGGHIEVESEPGSGTMIRIYLPLMENKGFADIPDSEGLIYEGHGETILLADDDPVVRMTECSVLESIGYHVIEAKDGLEAVSIFQRHRQEISLVILDMIMPNMNGLRTASEIESIAPDLPIMFISGLDDRESAQLLKGRALLNKPFTVHALSEAVYKELSYALPQA